MTIIGGRGRTEAGDRETLGLTGLRGQGHRGGIAEDALRGRQRLSVSPWQHPSRAHRGRHLGAKPPRTWPRSRHDLEGVIQPKQRHEFLLLMVIEECQGHSAMAASAETCTQPITRPIIAIMRALGDRRLHYIDPSRWPMIARQPCHAAAPDPPPSKREKWLWETSTREINARLKLARGI